MTEMLLGNAAQRVGQAFDRVAQSRQLAAMAARRVREHLVQAELLHEQRRQPVAPVIEIASDEDGIALGHQAANALGQRQDLAAAAAGEQAQVDHEAMHGAPVQLDAGMQQAALFEAVVGDVLVLVLDDRKARQQRVAMVGLVADGVAPVGYVQPQRRGQRFMLRVQQRLVLVAPLHFLQEDQVGTQPVQAQAQLVQESRRPSAERPLWML